MTHIGNIPHIINNGITHRNSPNANKHYVPIGDSSLINTRNERTISFYSKNNDCNGTFLIGDCTPFYLGCRTPMLYVIQKGYNGVEKQSPSNIIYMACSVQSIIDVNLDFYFSDGHCIDMFSSCYDKTRVSELTKLVNLPSTKIRDWTTDPDAKRKKEAEFLIVGDIPYNCITGFICYNENSKQNLLSYGITNESIIVDHRRYF